MARWFNIGGSCIAADHFDEPWDEKSGSMDVPQGGKTIHVVGC